MILLISLATCGQSETGQVQEINVEDGFISMPIASFLEEYDFSGKTIGVEERSGI